MGLGGSGSGADSLNGSLPLEHSIRMLFVKNNTKHPKIIRVQILRDISPYKYILPVFTGAITGCNQAVTKVGFP